MSKGSPGKKILYWSDRRVETVAEGHGIHLQPRATTEWMTPGLGALPVARRQQPARPLSRIEKAEAVEAGLSGTIERSFDSQGPCAFVAGQTSISFARLQAVEDDNHAVMLAEFTPPTGHSVAICLFGSMTNFVEFVQTAQPPPGAGWSSSAAPEVLAFILSRCSEIPPGYHERTEIAIEALKIADGQGLNGRDDDPVNMRPWRRAYTLGDVRETAEWLAEVYYDVDLLSEIGEPFDGYGRIVIGAPLWIMTPYVKNIRLYEEHTLAVLDQSETSTSKWRMAERWLSRGKS